VPTATADVPTVTGLDPRLVAKLSTPQKRALLIWHESIAGDDEGRPWYPGAIRKLPLEDRLELATDDGLAAAWEAQQRRHVKLSTHFFVVEYGHLQPNVGPPIPFDMWPEQAQTLDDFLEHLRVVVLKARQLGLTWLALHLAVWLMAFAPGYANTRVLALSKTGADAQALLRRARRINELLPPYLNRREDPESVGSLTLLKLLPDADEPDVGGGILQSLMSTPAAARSLTGTIALLDEFAFTRNGTGAKVLSAVLGTLGEAGRAIMLSTGNGDSGDGAEFAATYTGAREGTKAWHGIFLPASVDPARRSQKWREAKRKEFPTLEEFEAEHPETEEQALQSPTSLRVYDRSAIAAAVQIGSLLDDQLEELIDANGVEWGIDWGDFQTFAVYAVPLGGGGFFVFDELVLPHVEPVKASESIIWYAPAGHDALRFTASFADKNPVGTNKTFARVLREARSTVPDRFPEKHSTVPFGTYKEGGAEKRRGVNTVGYIQHLLEASASFDGRPDEAEGLLAISPRCKMLPTQMRNLEKDVETGKVKKPSLDPRHPERGDHGPDALIALTATRAAKFRRAKVPA
jgi:hypothetical protein